MPLPPPPPPPPPCLTLSRKRLRSSGFVRCVTGSSPIARLRALGLHLTQRGVAGDARVMFLRDLMQTRCFACYTLRKHGRCGGDESGGRKCDDRCLHFSVFPPWNEMPGKLKLDPFRERATSRYSEGVEPTFKTG